MDYKDERHEMNERMKSEQELKEKMAKEQTINMGQEYTRRVGFDKLAEIELGYKTLFQAYARIMGSSIRMNLQTIEAMMLMISNIPTRCGMDLVPRLTELQAELAAVRNHLVAKNTAIATASMNNGLSTDSSGEEKK